MRILLLASGLLLLAACNILSPSGNSGSGPTRSYSVSAFTGVTLAGPYDVVVTYGPTHAVRAEGNPQALDRLTIRTEDGELWIGEGRGGLLSPPGAGKVIVHVTVPRLESAAIGGSGDIRIDKATSQSFEGTIGGSGNLRIDALTVRNAKFTIAGPGNLKVGGTSDHGEFRIAGSGDVDAHQLRSRTAAVSIAGSGSVKAYASDSANISIMGSGDVDMQGTDRCTISKLGPGDVKCHGAPSNDRK